MKRSFVLLIALALLSLPLMAQSEPAYDEATQQKIVRAAYARLGSYTVLAEETLEFQLSDFETIYPDQFDAIRWLDVVSMPEGWVVNMNRAYKTNKNLNERRVSYEPSWGDQEAVWMNAPEAAELPHLSIAEVLAASSSETEALSQVTAITTYSVTVTFGDQTRSYWAAFLWVPSEAEEGFDTAFIVVDNITQGVEEAVREATAPLLDRNFLSLTGDLKMPSDVPTKASCPSGVQRFSRNGYASGSNNHFSGVHYSQVTLYVDCWCDSSCYGHCTGGISGGVCTCSGWPSDMCHKMASASDVYSETRWGGNQACSAGFGCAQKSCLFCLCGLSVSAKAEGAEVKFGADGAAWTGHLEYGVYCAPCG